MEEIGEINLLNFQSMIDNYEVLIKDLTSELDFFKSEHTTLKTKMTVLIQENERLSNEVKQLMDKHEKSLLSCTYEESELVTNLKEQLSSLIAEREYSVTLWQNAIKTIDFLEDELRMYQTDTQGFVPKNELLKLKTSYQEKIQFMEKNLSLLQEKFKQAVKNASNEFQNKYSEIERSMVTEANAFKIVRNLEEEILNLQDRLQESVETQNKLEIQLKENEKLLENCKLENKECKAKVKEAVQVVEGALKEKDAALFRENDTKEELQKLNQALSEVIEETKHKIDKEIDSVKTQYSKKEMTLLHDLKMVQEELRLKDIETEKLSSKCCCLENEIQRIQKGSVQLDESSTSKLLILEKNLETTFQKLLLAEKTNIQLVAERDSIKSDIDQMSSHYERDIKSREVEKITLQNKIKQLQSLLDESNSSIVKMSEDVEKLNKKIQDMESNFQNNIEQKEKLFNTSHSETILELNKDHNQQLLKIQNQLDSQKEINKRWRTETKSIVENLEKLISNMKNEIIKLKGEKRKLCDSLKIAENKLEQYKIVFQLISSDVNKIKEMTCEKQM